MRPVDALELEDRLAPVWQAMQEVWSTVWVIGTPAVIRLANNLVYVAANVFTTTAAHSQDRLVAMQQFEGLRADFGVRARAEMGLAPADLFGCDREPPGPRRRPLTRTAPAAMWAFSDERARGPHVRERRVRPAHGTHLSATEGPTVRTPAVL